MKKRVRGQFVAMVLAAMMMTGGCGNEAAVDETGTTQVETVNAEDIIELGTMQVATTEEASMDDTSMKETSMEETLTEEASTEEIYEGPVSIRGDARNCEPVKVKGIYVSGPIAGSAKMDELIALVDETELNAMVIDVKNDEGTVTYKMDNAMVQEIGSAIGYIQDIDALVAKCKEHNIYLIARVVAFKDPYLANARTDMAIKTTSGGIYKDKSGLAWVNPYNRDVWDYLVGIANQAVSDGFDEVQFDYIRFSENSKDVDYGEDAQTYSKTDIITEFTKYAYDNISPSGAYVSADVFGTIIDSTVDQEIVGQIYSDMAAYLDYICPMVYPSHYANGCYGISVPDANPYKLVKSAMLASRRELSVLDEDNCAQGRAWLQAFTASWVDGHISYDKQAIRDQIQGAYEAGCDEWILWNASVSYSREKLLTDEEAATECETWTVEPLEEPETETETELETSTETEMESELETSTDIETQSTPETSTELETEPETITQ